jgi:hypothetical protein
MLVASEDSSVDRDTLASAQRADALRSGVLAGDPMIGFKINSDGLFHDGLLADKAEGAAFAGN